MPRFVLRRSVILVLMASALLAVFLVDGALADTAVPPEGLAVRELNVDADGNIKIHEQGVVPVADNGGSLTVDGSVSVNNFPATQAVSQDGSWNVGITGTPSVHVDNFPSTSSPIRTSAFVITELPVQPTAGTVVPFGFIATDIFASFAAGAGGNCLFELSSGGATFYVERTDVDGRGNVILNLTTGIEGPISISLTAQGPTGARCSGRLNWTGVALP